MTDSPQNILTIDDQAPIRELFSTLVTKAGHRPFTAKTLAQGLDIASTKDIATVLLDIRLPDGSGLDIIQDLRNMPSRPEVIVITGFADLDGAERALTQGAFDYVPKPVSVKQIALILKQALEYRRERLKREPTRLTAHTHIIGSSPTLKKALDEMAEAARGEHSVLVTGSTGTGKELFARAVHDNSPRMDKPFVTVDCAVLTDSLVENALFGHSKGSFTGAVSDKEGLVALAHGGTLFLDEIGELSASNQKVLLRVLETKTYRRIGSTKERTSDFRLVAATNKDLDSPAEQEKFRNDLLFRIRSHEIHLPPLKARQDDVRLLAEHYTATICGKLGMAAKTLSQGFLETLQSYEWPGNVRELVNLMERVIAKAAKDPILHQKHLPVSMRVAVLKNQFRTPDPSSSMLNPDSSPLSFDPIPDWKNFKDLMYHETERRYFQDLWSHFGGDVKHIARQAGLTRSRVYSILNKYDISND
ncbi:sigma-54-dependent transcriptional regulator [Desulfoplanes sp.]